MKFYQEWLKVVGKPEEIIYIKSFVNSTPQSLEPLINGNKKELKSFVFVMFSTPISKLIEQIDIASPYFSEDVVQFSNFDHAITNVLACCEFEENGLTFTDLGRKIMHSKEEGACKKYGENHAKLAAVLSLVSLNKNKSFYVKNTALGSFVLSLDKEDKYEIVKKLAVRNCFIKSLIYLAKKGVVHYMDLSSKVLSESTLIRRKSNVKFLVNLLLENEPLKNNIIW